MTARAHWEKINELFDAIADLPTDERAAALEAASVPDAIRNEVRSLLVAMDTDSAGFDAGVVLDSFKTTATATALAGQRLGPWQVVREIGRGGMGAVFEAFRADDQYQKRVAVKTLARVIDSADTARRFQQERQILASLEHANVASLIDGGQTADGLPYLVMEFVDGEPIDRYCEINAQSLRERLDLFRQVCAAVQYAHRHFVVHRDLKPSNILVRRDGAVKLVDFGIAKLLDDGAGNNAAVTETGYRAFTTGFASPEQVRGLKISTSTDVYSLGVVLYLLLTGRLPFDVSNTSPGEAIRLICEEPAVAPSRTCTDDAARAMGFERRDQLVRTLTGELDDIVLTALRKEPERRYANVGALSDDLKRYLQGLQVLARPDTWRYRFYSLTRRNPKLMAALAVAVLSLSAGSLMASWQARFALRERDRARLESIRSENVVAFLEQTLASPTQAALSGATIEQLDQTVVRAAVELRNEPLARAAIYRTIANAYVIHYRAERARFLLDSALLLDRQSAGDSSTAMARDLTVAARLVFIGGQYDSAVAYSREAVSLLRRRPSNRPADYTTALMYLGFALTYSGAADSGKTYIQEAIALERARLHSNLLPYLWVALADAEVFSGREQQAIGAYRRSLALFDSLPVPDPAERGIAELGLARLLGFPATIDEADAHARRAHEILVRRWGESHPYTAQAYAILGRIASAQGKHDSALRLLRTAIDILEKVGAGPIEVAGVEFDRSRVLFRLGRYREMETALLASRQQILRDTPDSWLMLATYDEFLGQAVLRQRRYREAMRHFDAAFRSMSGHFGGPHERTQSAARLLLLSSILTGDTTAVREIEPLIAPPDSVEAIRDRATAIRNGRAQP
jgi:serine/threonine-protein kinase